MPPPPILMILIVILMNTLYKLILVNIYIIFIFINVIKSDVHKMELLVKTHCSAIVSKVPKVDVVATIHKIVHCKN